MKMTFFCDVVSCSHNLEDSYLHIRRQENLKSQLDNHSERKVKASQNIFCVTPYSSEE
jgi:hypothetical protein